MKRSARVGVRKSYIGHNMTDLFSQLGTGTLPYVCKYASVFVIHSSHVDSWRG